MDIVQEIFKSINFEACIYLHSEFCSPWGVTSENPNKSSFHVIADGDCQLLINKNEPISLMAGDLIFFPRDIKHQILNQEKTKEVSTTLICGHLTFNVRDNPILNSLPDYLHIKSDDMNHYKPLKMLFQQIIQEAENQSKGRQLVLDKLADILFIYIVRYYLNQNSNDSSNRKGVLNALGNKQITKALMEFHLDMSLQWTLDKLADAANMSRSKFAALFKELIGMTPLNYMTYWRMQLARQQLLLGNQSVYAVSLTCGYQSEAAFIKVYKKHFGKTPGQTRRLG